MLHLKSFLPLSGLFFLLSKIGMISLIAQTSYYYPLNNSYNEATGSAPALVTIPNDAGQIGAFASRALSACPCSDGGVFSGYAYPYNAGFRFDIPSGFISCEYSIQFTWQYRIKARDLNGQTLVSRVEEFIAPVSFRVYPNPTSDLVWIDIPAASFHQELEIWSIHGHLLRRETLSSGRNRLSLEGLPDGLLLLRIGTEDVIRLIKR